MPAPVGTSIAFSNGYVLPNGARRDADAKLDEQLVGDPLFAPRDVRDRHFSD